MPRKFVIGIGIVVSAIGYFFYAGLQQGTTFYVTVPELYAHGSEIVGKSLRMGGLVLEGSITQNPRDLLVEFKLHQGSDVVPVRYQGVTPDMFKDGSEVIVEGTLSDTGVFEADWLMAKCPSKYESKEYKAPETGPPGRQTGYPEAI